jgi:hypothetical protein
MGYTTYRHVNRFSTLRWGSIVSVLYFGVEGQRYTYLYLSLSEFHKLWKSLPNLCFSPTNLGVQCGHHRTVFLFLCLRSFLHNNWKFSHQNLHWFVPASQMAMKKVHKSALDQTHVEAIRKLYLEKLHRGFWSRWLYYFCHPYILNHTQLFSLLLTHTFPQNFYIIELHDGRYWHPNPFLMDQNRIRVQGFWFYKLRSQQLQ